MPPMSIMMEVTFRESYHAFKFMKILILYGHLYILDVCSLDLIGDFSTVAFSELLIFVCYSVVMDE